jgi:UDP-glucuronate 4-epimerase
LEKSAGIESHLKYMPMQEGDVVRTFADITKARTELGYNPEIDLETGIKNYLKWFREFILDSESPDLIKE